MGYSVISIGGKTVLGKLVKEETNFLTLEHPVIIDTTTVDGKANIAILRYNSFSDENKIKFNKKLIEQIGELTEGNSNNNMIIPYYEDQVDYLYNRKKEPSVELVYPV